MPFLSFIACPDQRNNKKRSCEKIISHFFTAPYTVNCKYVKGAEGKNKKLSKIAGLNKFLRIYYARVMEVYQ